MPPALLYKAFDTARHHTGPARRATYPANLPGAQESDLKIGTPAQDAAI
jgi:hypothetical protein